MALNGWHWTIFGAIISGVSGYVYLNIPRNGSPNTAMALFFFIGIVFFLIGMLKLFFRKVDDKNIFDSARKSEEQNTFKTLSNQQSQLQNNDPAMHVKPNRVDEVINNIARHHAEKKKVEMHDLNTQHSNTYAKMHQYHGPLKTAHNTSANSQHPIHSHVAPKIQNTAEHGIKCRKCGNVNTGHSNYCHQCGNRLK